MDEESPASRPPAQGGCSWPIVMLGVLVLTLVYLATPGHTYGIRAAPESGAMQSTRTIELAMFQYANDHDGNYPTGRSSTEVFQKLIDGDYVPDPSLFYLKMSGKSKPWAHFWSWTLSRHLTPKNVAYDVTAAMTLHTPDDVPGVFATGSRIEYKPGGRAVPLAGEPRPSVCADGLPIVYHSNNAWYKESHDPSGVVTNIISATADLGTNTYTQLTPDGPLPAQ